jgi:hypothetical protein
MTSKFYSTFYEEYGTGIRTLSLLFGNCECKDMSSVVIKYIDHFKEISSDCDHRGVPECNKSTCLNQVFCAYRELLSPFWEFDCKDLSSNRS